VNFTILLQKLIEIEKSIGADSRQVTLEKVFDLEICLLEMQREMAGTPTQLTRALPNVEACQFNT
jgi:hypothetical protein